MITGIWAGFHDTAYGIAFDIGSTTVAGHLCDLGSGDVLASAGAMNPQIRFGEDLMSRVSYVMMHPGSEKELTRAVRGCLAKLTAELAKDAGVSRDDILEITVVGNPIMHHLFLGLDPTELGGAPFALAIDEAVRRPAAGLGFPVHPGARVYVLPCIAGHVGADAAGVILSEGPYLGDEVNLIVDVGTNAEIVLGNRDQLLAASSPTGPAFEGAQISCGQRAAPGAIERVRIDPETLEPRFRVIGVDAWSDEPEFAGTHVTGVCGSGIIEAVAEMHLAGILTTDGTIDGALAARSARIVADDRTFSYVISDGEPLLTITQNDVRQIQLAKAALHAGCTLLLEHYGIARVDRIRLAGAFGNHIDPMHALVLGLVPDCDPANVTSAGNAAGTGARIALLDRVRPRGDRGGREARGEDRDSGRATLPGALRRRDGRPARHRSLRAAARRRPPAPAPRGRGRGRRRAAPAPFLSPKEPRMSSETTGRRSGGRAARQAARAVSNAVSVPYITRTLQPFEVLSDEQLELIESNADTVLEQVGIDFRDTPEALTLFKEAGAEIDGERVRFPRGLCRHIVQASAPARFTQVARNPAHNVEIGGPSHGLRARLRLAVRARPRRRPPLRHDRGLPQLREAHVHDAVPAPLGRHGVRARRPAGQQAALRHGLRAHALLGQALHGLGHAPQAGAGHGRDGADPVRP